MELGLNYTKGPLLLKEIAKRQEISLKYLDHIFSLLKKIGIVKSADKGLGDNRGVGGDYSFRLLNYP